MKIRQRRKIMAKQLAVNLNQSPSSRANAAHAAASDQRKSPEESTLGQRGLKRQEVQTHERMPGTTCMHRALS
jgi:hypothetical protein